MRLVSFSLLLGTTLLCAAGARAAMEPTSHGVGTGSMDGKELLKCVHSVMERARHGDVPTDADRLFYSHRRYFGRQWAGDYLFSRKFRIKYFQIPTSGSTAVRRSMSMQFDVPYVLGNLHHYNRSQLNHQPSNTPRANRVKPKSIRGEALEYFTFTSVAEPVTRLVHSILETRHTYERNQSLAEAGEHVAAKLRRLIEQERDPTGEWTSEKSRFDVHWTSQVALLMDMFDASTPPRLDYVAHVEQDEAVAWDHVLMAYARYNLQHGVVVDPRSYTPTKTGKRRVKHDPQSHDASETWAVLHRDPQLLCDAVRMLEFDYECLPAYPSDRWCVLGNASLHTANSPEDMHVHAPSSKEGSLGGPGGAEAVVAKVDADQMQGSAKTPAFGHMCFTDRRDEQSIDGEWQETTHPPTYGDCPLPGLVYAGGTIRKSGNCSASHGDRVGYEFYATSCTLPPMDALDLMRVIGLGATLWFLGDSVTVQMFMALVCALQAGGATLDPIFRDYRGKSHIPKKHIPKQHVPPERPCPTCPYECVPVHHVDGRISVRICVLKTYYTETMYDDLVYLNSNAHQTTHQETLVVNYGLHHETTLYEEIHSTLQRWQVYRPPTGRKLRLVWRDTSPQHFAQKPDGGFHGVKHGPCVAIGDMRAAWEPYQNMTAILSEFPEIHRLPIWSITAPRFDAHGFECTHWCLPGVPDVWVQLLYALLKAQTDQN